MRAHVALTPAEFRGLGLGGSTAMVVDVLRATTTVVAACAAGCTAVVPVPDPEAARARARSFPGEVLLAGEQGGDPIPGFDLGNSPLEYVPERVAGRVIVMTTTNGTAAMLLAGAAAGAGAAALVNVSAAAAWALEQVHDLVVLCSGEQGGLSLEDVVCAGLLIRHVAARCPALEISDGARVAMAAAADFGSRLERLTEEAAWARRLIDKGHAADVTACLRLDTSTMVPVFRDGAIVPERRPAAIEPGDLALERPR